MGSRDSTVMKKIYMAEVLGHDALRMRLRRLVEVKPNGKCHVDQQTREEYQNPERREWLEMALLQSIKKHGTSRTAFTKIRVGGCPKDDLMLIYIYKYFLYIANDGSLNSLLAGKRSIYIYIWQNWQIKIYWFRRCMVRTSKPINRSNIIKPLYIYIYIFNPL